MGGTLADACRRSSLIKQRYYRWRKKMDYVQKVASWKLRITLVRQQRVEDARQLANALV